MTAEADWAQLLGDAPVLPVVAVDDPERAVALSRALVEGGLPCVEITLRSPKALACIARVAAEVPGAMVGAGTLTRAGEVAEAEAAGARFLVSPGLTPTLADALLASKLPALPGVATPSEALAARERGFGAVKVFPAAALGGPGFLRALAAVTGDLRLCPTGGVGPATLAEYFACPRVFAAGASWPCAKELIAEGRWGEVRERAQTLASAARAALAGEPS